MIEFLPSWLVWYKKPSYRDPKTFASAAHADLEKGRGHAWEAKATKADGSIPPDLTLDRVMANKTCAPLSLYDFYMYLKHVEMSPENLEFLIWFEDYKARYHADRTSTVSTLNAPILSPWGTKTYGVAPPSGPTPSDSDTALDTITKSGALMQYIESLFPIQQCDTRHCRSFWPRPSQGSDATLMPPFSGRDEMDLVVALFIAPGGRKELNLPDHLRREALAHLAQSDDPAHLVAVADCVYYLLRNCSHRNFVRLGVKNGTFETLCMVTIVGITCTAVGLLTMLLVAFASPAIHQSSRWRGLGAAPFWFVGFCFLLAGLRGSCFLLLLVSRRQQLPWERAEAENGSARTSRPRSRVTKFFTRLMIFERKIRVEDRGLRSVQRKIVIQSVVGAIVATTILEVIFLCLPIWK